MSQYDRTQEYRVSCILHHEMPPQYIKIARSNAQEECLRAFQKILFDGTQKIFSVQAIEKEIPGFEQTQYDVSLLIGRVEVHNQHIIGYEEMNWKALTHNATQEVKNRIVRKVKSWLKLGS